MELLLQALLDRGLVFVGDEDETPPLLELGVNRKFYGFDLVAEMDTCIRTLKNHSPLAVKMSYTSNETTIN